MAAGIAKVAAVLLVLATAACRMQHIYSVQDHPIPTASRDLRSEEISRIIVDTARANGWLAEQTGPREVRATTKWKDHSAVVLITHDNRNFSIRNEGSSNLKQQDDVIHRAYNQRVQSLEAAIERRLYQRP